jgi:hypothetical protein
MFHKFSLTPGKARGRTNTTGHKFTSRDRLAVPRVQPKRRKISRACDRCRLQRIKCDEQKPCARCVSSDAECIVSHAVQGSTDAPNLVANDVEDELSTFAGVVDMASVLSPLTIAALAVDPHTNFHISLKPSDLASDIHQLFASGFTTVEHATVGSLFPQLPSPAMPSGARVPEPLLRDERKRYLRIFWDACQPYLQIMSETEFTELEARVPSTTLQDYSVDHALLDVMVALSMQHGHATGLDERLVATQRPSFAIANEQIDWAGFEHFHRSRERMRTNAEVNLQAIRCHVLMIVYLMRGSAFRDAYNMLGITVRKAYVAELQRPPPNDLPESGRTSRMQLWWLIFLLDLQCSLQLSMPTACQKSIVKCPRPTTDSLERYLSPCARYGDNLTACNYSTVMVDLATIVTDINSCVCTADLLDDSNDDLDMLESLASNLSPSLQGLEDWHDQLPELLASDNTVTEPHSFDIGEATSLPVWLQRQRIFLELHYHNAHVLILRSFVSVCFAQFTEPSGEAPANETEQSHVQSHISRAMRHATAIVDIIFTISSSSDILYGWPEVLHPLWNSTIVLVTYTYANSLNPSALAAMQSLTRADSVFKCFSTTSVAASSTSEVVRSLIQRLEDLQSLSA